MEHVQQVPVTVPVTTRLDHAEFQEILDLGPGDILLLDKPVDRTAELIVNGRPAFAAVRPSLQGQYAVLIKEGVPPRDDSIRGRRPRPAACTTSRSSIEMSQRKDMKGHA